ncbi:hypothetical protein [uncultured Paenibacillus sp.]|uniref:hypothetical protein n=1 Tax=uncultured Paenibacillus sp. TaxID=227322 RepID=UPI0025EA7589|nr:hypothetical protein [uncultured Paenibacillus sp.]
MSTVVKGLSLSNGEEIRAVLGKGNIGNKGQKPVVVLTNKYIHFFGEHYRYDNGDTSRKIFEPESIPLQDFIGTGYIRKRSRRNLYYLVTVGVLITILMQISRGIKKFGVHLSQFKLYSSIMAGVFVIALVLYLFKGYKLFEVAFVGKRLCISEHHFEKSDIQLFIQSIYQAKRKVQ